jgi:hypothetical protein
MVHVFIDPNELDWYGLVAAQEGRGPALAGSPKYFQGMRYQRGAGVLGSIARFLMPIAKNIVSSVGEEGLAAGQRILSDVSQGKNVKEALKEHSKAGLEKLATKLEQCGKGRKRKTPARAMKAKRRYIDQLTYF